MNEKIDLHLHSRYSDDGTFSPAELVRDCKERGIAVMAIADHNCVRANKEGKAAALAVGISYICATELDCGFEGVNLHVLGYGIDFENPYFAEIEDNITGQSAAASRKMLESTRRLGFDISEAQLEPFTRGMYWKERWTGELFAEAMLQNHAYDAHPLLLPYRPGGARSDNPYVNFYWDYYSQGKPCYVEMRYPSLARVVEGIHKSGGKAVLAHPAVNLKGREELLGPIVTAGLDGIEAFSSYHKPAQADYYYNEAIRRGLLITCGSDFHGKTKPAIAIGQHGCRVERNILNMLGK